MIILTLIAVMVFVTIFAEVFVAFLVQTMRYNHIRPPAPETQMKIAFAIRFLCFIAIFSALFSALDTI